MKKTISLLKNLSQIYVNVKWNLNSEPEAMTRIVLSGIKPLGLVGIFVVVVSAVLLVMRDDFPRYCILFFSLGTILIYFEILKRAFTNKGDDIDRAITALTLLVLMILLILQALVFL